MTSVGSPLNSPPHKFNTIISLWSFHVPDSISKMQKAFTMYNYISSLVGHVVVSSVLRKPKSQDAAQDVSRINE